MVQMVFVHGVATRTSEAYEQEERNRDKLFKEVLFEGTPLNIRAPRWGDLVPALSHGGAAFGGAAGVAAYGGFGEKRGDPEGGTIAELARQSPSAALDAVYATMVERADRANEDLTDDDIAAFRVVSETLAKTEPALIPASATDEELIFNLGKTTEAGGSYGIVDKITGAVVALADRARNTVSTGLANAFRDELNPLVGRFLGDVFVYLKDADARRKIQAEVAKAVIAAHDDAKASGEKLVLIGHSLGGVILYDMLSSPREAGLPDDLCVDALLTVGSQPGLFEEMGLFAFKSPGAVATPGPAGVKAWQNIFDPIDVFGFRVTPIFKIPSDFVFDSVTGLLSAHTTYFKRPQFHGRARARLKALGVIGTP